MYTALSHQSTTQNPQIVSAKLIWIAPLAMSISIVANLGLYAAAGSLFPEVTAWEGASSAQIIGATIVYLLIGTLTFAVIKWRSSQPIRHYWIAATIGLILSFWMPISMGLGFAPPELAPPSVITVITLCLMHILSYVISVPLYVTLSQK